MTSLTHDASAFQNGYNFTIAMHTSLMGSVVPIARPKSVAFLITGLATGGAETMMLKLLQNLDRRRFAPHVISLTTKGEIGPRIEAIDIPVYVMEMKSGMPSPLKFIHLVKLLRELRPDLLHTWMYHADLLGGLAARLAGIRSVVWGVRNSDLSPDLSKSTTLMTAKVCAQLSGWLPERILTCSDRAKSVHVNAGYREDKFVLIPNGFDIERFAPDSNARVSVRNELGLAPSTPLIGLIARKDSQKNHIGFVEAAARVHQAQPNVHFLLAGTGIDSSNGFLVQAIEKVDLLGHFHMLGRRDDIPRLMAALDVLASSSSFGEAFPNVLGEAMACAVPCVVTDVGDSADIVGDTGKVVPSGEMGGLAQNIVELLDNPDQCRTLGLRARQQVKEKYEIGKVTRLYEAFYAEMLANQ
jgi:glycosyltransferase involved in cell wall biosynthesis